MTPGSRASGTPRDVRLCLLGYGNVARAFCDLLARQERQLADRHGLRLLVNAVGTRHGSLLAPGGLPPAAVLATIGARPAPPQAPLPAAELLAASAADILVELTVLEHDGAPLSTGHVLAAIELGMHVVTANKGPIAWNWRGIADVARAAERRVRFESAVMDGLPVFSLLDFTLPDCALLGFEAVFNATTNSILEAMGSGQSLADALADAQAQGFAEADPSNDLDGWDAAYKAAALANAAMDARMTPLDVARERLTDVPLQRVLRAREHGKRLRLVTSVRRETPAGVAPEAGSATSAGPIRACVQAAELDIDHPLAALSGDSLGVVLHTDLMGDLVVSELHGLVPQTAYGVYADILHICA